MTLEQMIDETREHITPDQIKSAIRIALKTYAEYEDADYDSYRHHMKMWARGRIDAHCALFGLDPDEVLKAGDHLG